MMTGEHGAGGLAARRAREVHVCTPGAAGATSAFPATQVHLLGAARTAQVRGAQASKPLSSRRHSCGRATAGLRVSDGRACGVDGGPQLVTSLYERFDTESSHVKMQPTTQHSPVCATKR